MGLTSSNSYSKDSGFEQSLKKGAEKEEVRNVRTERGIAEKEIKKKEERKCWKLTRASEQFFNSFLFISIF